MSQTENTEEEPSQKRGDGRMSKRRERMRGRRGGEEEEVIIGR